MAWPYTKDEITDVLVGKLGFAQDDRDHDWYVLDLDGRTAAYTYVSRGHRDRVTPKIAKKMAVQMRLATLQEFRDAIDCPLSADDYYQLVRERRGDQDEAVQEVDAGAGVALPAPRQPLLWMWTWTGMSFGYRQDDVLYTYGGRPVGKIVNDEIYGADGRYLGEIRNYNSLIVDEAKAEREILPFELPDPYAPVDRWGDRGGRLPLPEQHRDFPAPDELVG